MSNSLNQGLNGLNPLSYMGVNPSQPSQFVTDTRPPTQNDSKNFLIGTIWLDMTGYPLVVPTAQNVYMLVALVGNLATWVHLGVTGTLTLTSNSGGAVSPDGAGNINLVGDGTTITGVGNPGTHTITFSTVGTGVLSTLTGNSGGAVSPLAGNINVVGDTTTINIVGNPGTHTLTASTTGSVSTSFPTDAGTATPALGVLKVLGGTAARDINTSASGNTIHIDLNNTITVGDLVNVPAGSNSITMTSGDLYLAGDSGVASAHGIAKIKFLSASGAAPTSDIYFYLNNIFIGMSAGNQTMTPSVALFNIGIGPSSCNALTTGAQNDCVGNGTLQHATTASNNVAMGYTTLNLLTTGNANTCLGSTALQGITTGSNNTMIGASVGTALVTGTESGNIFIGAGLHGTNGDNNTIRIGYINSVSSITRTFIDGIRGITTTNNDAVAVLVDSAGQLGTVSSSARYKENIKDMGSSSEDIYRLRPVTFNYKNRFAASKSYGLIAEEVHDVFPDLVVYDVEGKPDTIKYQDLPVLLLNEIIKLKREIAELKSK